MTAKSKLSIIVAGVLLFGTLLNSGVYSGVGGSGGGGGGGGTISGPLQTKVAFGEALTVTATLTSTPTVGHAMVVGITSNLSSPLIAVTDNQGNSYSQVSFSVNGFNGELTASIWCAPVFTANGTFTITATTQNASTYATILAAEYSGLSCNPDKSANAISSSSPYSCGTYTTVNSSSDLLVAVLNLNIGGTAAASPSSGYTTRASQTNGNFQPGFYADQIIVTTSSQTPQWTSASSAQSPCAAVALTAAGSGGF